MKKETMFNLVKLIFYHFVITKNLKIICTIILRYLHSNINEKKKMEISLENGFPEYDTLIDRFLDTKTHTNHKSVNFIKTV